MIKNGRVDHAHRWDIRDPALYKAVVALHKNGEEIDLYETPFGIRDFSYTAKGLLLNGRLVQIKGACVHLDFAGVGTAQHDDISAYKIRRLRDMGCNAYRSSHNPATIELLDECDRQGMIVLDENRVAETAKYRLEDLEELIKRGRNHPGILFWSLSNEAGNSGSPQTGRAIRRLIALVRKLDPDRIVLSAEANMFGEEAAKWARENYGIYGFNYPEALLDNVLYKQAREADPDLMIMSTENVSHLITRGAYADNPERGHCSQFGTAYDQSGKTGNSVAGGAAFPWQAMDFYRENPGTGGHFIWTGFDYRGETTPFFNAQSISNYGVMDYCGFPKDTYYYYQSVFLKEAMIHITPHWTYPKPIGEEVELRIFTNCDEVELILNGISLGKKEKKGHWSEWRLPFEPGVLEAIGYRNGIETVRDSRITAGEPARLHLSADKAHAHAGSIVFVTAKVEDADGNVVPYAENKISFHAEGGKIMGTGNGDPGSFEDDLLSGRRAFGGLCMALAKVDEDKENMIISAKAEGLATAQIQIEIATTHKN